MRRVGVSPVGSDSYSCSDFSSASDDRSGLAIFSRYVSQIVGARLERLPGMSEYGGSSTPLYNRSKPQRGGRQIRYFHSNFIHILTADFLRLSPLPRVTFSSSPEKIRL